MQEIKIKPGYKMTELGVIPEDWNISQIKDICEIKTGGKNTQDKIDDGKYPFFVRSQTIERINSYSFDGEAILTAGDGVGTGKIFHYLNGKFDYHQRVYKMSYFKGIDGYYFYLYFSNNFYNRVMQMTAKSSVDSVRLEMISDMKIPVPKDINEQKNIAQVLSDTDELIKSIDELIEKKEKIKVGTMQELLTGKRKLPGFDGEWKEKQLGEICEIKKGQLITSETCIIGNIPVIAGGKQPAYYHNLSNRKANTITISASGANAGYINFHKDPIFASDCSTIEESNNYSIYFIYNYLQLLQDKIYKSQTGGAQPHIHPSDLNPMKINIPKTIEEQYAVAEVLSDMDNEIENLKTKRDKYNQIKEGMIQELLTGKIRLS